MTDDDANLSIDFLVAFTIFMVAFIWVATLVPNLFIGVTTHEIDFDSVAYRTSVILAEDPGAFSTANINHTRWEFEPNSGKDNIQRFGLAISKKTPNVLSEIKVKRFFDTTVFLEEDYRTKAIFGDYPYRFNISLKEEGKDPLFVGDWKIPENYGYIRKQVRIKHFSNATIDQTDVQKFKLNSHDTSSLIQDGNVTEHDFVIQINRSKLLYDNLTTPVINPNFDVAYRIDPRTEEINITIEDFHESPPVGAWVAPRWAKIELGCVTLSQTISDEGDAPTQLPAELYKDYVYHNMVQKNPPFELGLDDTLSVIFKPGFFPPSYDSGSIYVKFRFNATTNFGGNPIYGLQYLNTSQSKPWELTYNATEVTQPVLSNAVMEVKIW